MSELDRLFGVSSSTEVTLEMDPGTFTSGRLTLLQQVGVNRVSMGVQSFNDELLKKCGRAHNLQEVYNAIDALHKSGLKNFSIDLISSLPFLTLDLWKDTLSCAVKAGTPHISIYDLQVEERTAFGRWYTPGEFPLPTDEISAEMYKTGVEILTSNGFEHYEVSNYAKDGYRSRHNQQYWKREQVYGFGVGAASYVKGVRFSRPPRINDYYNYVNSLVSQDIPDLKRDQAKNVEEDDMLESIMLALRTADGIDVTKFEREYGLHAIKKIAKSLFPFEENVICLVDEKPIQLNTLLNAVESNNHSSIRLRLSDPKGFLISNDIISSVFAAF